MCLESSEGEPYFEIFHVAAESSTGKGFAALNLTWMFRKPRRRAGARRITQAALAGTKLHDLMLEAVNTVLEESGADRAGVWMKCADATEEGSLSFRGMVADQAGETLPAEWKRLTPDESLPRALLSGRSVDQKPGGRGEPVTIGASMGMLRAIWVPIRARGNLRGVIFAGAQKRAGDLDKARVESVATELSLALELEDERAISRQRLQDLIGLQHMLLDLGSWESSELLLQNLTENSTKTSGDEHEPGAVSVAIGELVPIRDDTLDKDLPGQGTSPRLKFLWHSSDSQFARVVESEPVAAVYRKALAGGRVVGSEPSAAAVAGIARVVAMPLQARGEALGVLVAGLPQGHASLAGLERLEVRAAAATQALLQRRQRHNSEQQRGLHQALLEAYNEPVVLLDGRARLAGGNGLARKLVGDIVPLSQDNTDQEQASGLFVSIFQVQEQERVASWLGSRTEAALPSAEENFETILSDGTAVRLRALTTSGLGYSAVLLQPARHRKQSTTAKPADVQLRNVIEWLEEGVVLFNARQEITAMNSRFARMAGLTPEQSVETRTLRDLVATMAPQTADPEHFAARWRALAYGPDTGVREEVELAYPAPRVLERVTRPVLDAAGGRLGRVEIYRDLTAQRLFHSKLLHTEKLAALGQMVSSIAHELSNPLTSILGYTQRLLARRGGETRESRQIFQEAERASRILKQLLMTARGTRPDYRKLALNDLVRSTVELQRFSLAAENVKVELQLDPALPQIAGDAGQLQQVLMNLIANARQAIQQGGKSGTIQLRTKREGTKRVLLEVIDNGPGIPDSILTRVFDPFFTTKSAGTGTGLGLSIVLGIVREHGGQVRVKSPPGRGAAFAMEFPVVPAEPSPMLLPAAETPIDRPEVSAETEAPLGPWAGCLALVVEDEATVGRLIADVLEDAGLTVDVLRDGREALQRASTEHYELVICDMRMPGLDGEQFFTALKRARSPWLQRILFVTGDVLAARTREFLERHQLPHLAKPFRVEELMEKVRQVLTESSPRETGQEKTKVARS